MAIDSLRISEVAPDPLVADFAAKVEGLPPMRILDAGAASGRNALYLASLGHTVDALDVTLKDLHHIRAQALGNVHVIAADVRNVPVRNSYDAVIMNYVLHELPMEDKRRTIQGLQTVTKPMGIHAISGYYGEHPEALQPLELHAWYAQAGWYIESYNEINLPVQQFAGKTLLSSCARIIAIKQ
jgi:2-polyprenyl-3-methyl-5-hydroxy-6-metoxy-1,4-benzoquinol methylase